MKKSSWTSAAEVERRTKAGPSGCRVEAIPGGPALVRGAVSVEDREGAAHPTSRPVVAVCLCGLSQREPWCDATHKAIQKF